MVQQMIPCLLMRGGTSRGTYFLKDNLPRDKEMLDQVLLKVMGSPDPLQIDGLGGATTTTSKVAVLSTSQEPGIDIDFLFAQVSVTTAMVDWGPTCGNILAGVGPAAIEMGLIKNIGQTETKVRIRLVNTGGFVEAVVQTPGGHVTYEGDAAIDGVPGTSAPIELNFVDVVGSKTGKLLPTGRLRDLINGVEVSCIDCAMPTVIARASALGKTGFESKLDLDLDVDFFRRIEGIRRRAGELMGLGDVAGRVVPKFAIVAEPRGHGNLTARYFVPTTTHASMAVTGGIAISCCSILEGTVAYEMAVQTPGGQHTQQVIIEHPAGEIAIILKAQKQAGTPEEGAGRMHVHSAGTIRTARLLFTGMVQVRRQDGRQPWTTTQREKERERSEQGAQGDGGGKRQGRGKAWASGARGGRARHGAGRGQQQQQRGGCKPWRWRPSADDGLRRGACLWAGVRSSEGDSAVRELRNGAHEWMARQGCVRHCQCPACPPGAWVWVAPQHSETTPPLAPLQVPHWRRLRLILPRSLIRAHWRSHLMMFISAPTTFHYSPFSNFGNSSAYWWLHPPFVVFVCSFLDLQFFIPGH